MRRAAIVGTGQTKCKERRDDVSFPGLIYEAATRALEDAGITIDDVDAVVFGSAPELFEGVNHPEQWCADASGAFLKPMIRVHTGGTVGASTGIAAFYYVAAGMFDTVLAVTGDKLSESPVQLGLSTVYDPILGRQFACGAPSAVALQARQYMHKYGVTEHEAALVAVKNRKNALLNPYAQLHIPNISVEMVMNSMVLSTPIKLLDSCPASDGACAMVIASEALAEKYADRPAWIKAVATFNEGVYYPGRNFADPLALMEAAKKVYKTAGITDPRREIDVAELYEAFSFQEMLWTEAMFFCERGEGGKLVESGATEMTGDLPVNPSGGVLSTNTIGATAMMRQAEAAMQVMGRAGAHQIDGARTAIAHGWGGGIQFHTLMIVSSDKN
ncbi:MAG TPA: thiolase domain-containing protein, partial [Blastocatellia bacterium]|nr:thiolase domain-containing protein [Blastocatellia bacterium]